MECSVTFVDQIQTRLTEDYDYRPLHKNIFEENIVEREERIKVGNQPRPLTYEYITTVHPDNFTKFQTLESEFDSVEKQAVQRVIRGLVLGVETQDTLQEYEWNAYVVSNDDASYKVQVIGEP